MREGPRTRRARRAVAAVGCALLLGALACEARDPGLNTDTVNSRDTSGDVTIRATDTVPVSVPVPGAPPAVAPAPDTAADVPLAVLRGYYDAINARDYPRAYAAWGDDGPPGNPTRRDFAAGFARTDSVRVAAGTPGRIEGAAGSRYVTIPVTVRSFERGGRDVTYTGEYVLRRSVVPGASAANGQWHLYRASLRATPPPTTR